VKVFVGGKRSDSTKDNWGGFQVGESRKNNKGWRKREDDQCCPSTQWGTWRGGGWERLKSRRTLKFQVNKVVRHHRTRSLGRPLLDKATGRRTLLGGVRNSFPALDLLQETEQEHLSQGVGAPKRHGRRAVWQWEKGKVQAFYAKGGVVYIKPSPSPNITLGCLVVGGSRYLPGTGGAKEQRDHCIRDKPTPNAWPRGASEDRKSRRVKWKAHRIGRETRYLRAARQLVE